MALPTTRKSALYDMKDEEADTQMIKVLAVTSKVKTSWGKRKEE
jgi:hypothetical protein